MKYFLVYLLLLGAFAGVFLIGKKNKKHDYVDILWGLGFALSALISWLAGPKSLPGGVMTLLTCIWGARLSLHLARRNIGKPEDFRYKAMRDKWVNRFEMVMFFKNYMTQFVINVIVGFPVVYVNLEGTPKAGLILWLGFVVWVVGFFFEAVGDEQLRRFKARPENKGRLMTEGLWAWTRHPNYFGDATMWWGIYLMSLSGDSGRAWLVFSPLLMTFMLLYVSGVPLLEKKYEGRADWEAYTRRTSKFFPRPPKGESNSGKL